MTDHVSVLRRLRWGQVPFANLRYRNGPNDRLKCALRKCICFMSSVSAPVGR